MTRITRLALIVMAALVLTATAASAIAATTAQAIEGPYYTVESIRLAKGSTKAIKAKVTKAYVFTAALVKVTCEKETLEKAVISGSNGATGGSGEQIIVFEGCTVAGNGEKCEVEGKKIATKALKTDLAFTNKESKAGEAVLVHFAPLAGAFATLKFTGTCTVKETSLEGSVDAEAWSGGKAIKVAEEPADVVAGEVNFPTAAIKASFIEEAGVRKEVKPALKAFGFATTVEGRSEVSLTSLEKWNVATALPPPPRVEQVDFEANQNILIDHRKDANHTELTKLRKEKLPAPEQPIELKGWDKDEIEWKSPKLSELTTNWPIAYAKSATVKLKARFALEAATQAFLEKQLEGNPTFIGKATIGGVAITFEATVKDVAEQLKKHATYLETPVMTTSAALSEKVRYELVTISWKWTVKEKGRAVAIEQQVGTSTHNFYTTFLKPLGSVYLTWLDAASQKIELETQPPGEPEALAGTWKVFSTFEELIPSVHIRIYNAATGEIKRTGALLWYYEEITAGLTLKQVLEKEEAAACGLNQVVQLLEWATGECGAWQKTFGNALETEGIKSTNVLVVVKFPEGPCAVAATCAMLVKNWKFEGKGTTGNAEFPYKESEVVDQNGIAGQGVKNPDSAFGNHQVIEAAKKLYDPSYGTEPLGKGKEGPLEEGAEAKEIKLAYQEKAIDGFCSFSAGAKEWQCQKAAAGTLKLKFE